MDVAFVSDVVYPFVTGGAQKRIYEIGRRVSADGHRVTVYGRQWWDGPPVIEQNGITLWGISQPRDLYAGERRSISEAIGFATAILRRLWRRLDNHDVVVASQFPYFPVIATKMATVFSDTPLVITWHEVWGAYWEEYLGQFAMGGKLTERVTARLPHVPVAVSNVTADQLAKIGPSRDKIEVVPNGVDIAHVRTVLPATPGYDVLFAGRLIADKNVDVLLEAFDQVAEQFDATLGIIGDGPERDPLEQRAGSLSHADRVTFLGRLDDHDQVLSYMQAADVFVSPSTREGFGITYVEAMAAGCTVVAVNHSRSTAREVVGDAGFLTELSVEGLTDGIARGITGEQPDRDPEDWVQQYDWDRIAQRAFGVYAKAVRSSSTAK